MDNRTKKLKKLKLELFNFAKGKNFDRVIIGHTAPFWLDLYGDVITEQKLSYVMSEICKLKEEYGDYKESHKSGSGVNRGLYNMIRIVLNHLNLEKNDYKVLYDHFSLFKTIYPELKYQTFTRAIRKCLFDIKEKPKPRMSGTDTESIKKVIKDYFSDKEVKLSDGCEADAYLTAKTLREYTAHRIVKSDNKKSNKFKRMVVLSDLHCGHIMGLTPPQWQYSKESAEWGDVAESQSDAWDWYVDTAEEIGKDIDILVVNGDMIDGRGERSGGTELITTDRLKQANIALECLKIWNPTQTFMTRGTPYHTGKEEQFEDVVAENLSAYIDNTLDIKVNGKIFNFRHKVGNSSVPYGKATQVVKESIWNLIQSVKYNMKSADVIIRSHVHYMTINQDSMRYSITTPGLQLNSRYGEQQCSGLTDFGFIVFDVYENGRIIVKPYVAKIREEETNNVIEI